MIATAIFSKPKNGHYWGSRVSYHDLFNWPIIFQEWIDCGFLVNNISTIGLDEGKMGTLQVNKKTRFLAEVVKQNMS